LRIVDFRMRIGESFMFRPSKSEISNPQSEIEGASLPNFKEGPTVERVKQS